jgi:hypothetical protein
MADLIRTRPDDFNNRAKTDSRNEESESVP